MPSNDKRDTAREAKVSGDGQGSVVVSKRTANGIGKWSGRLGVGLALLLIFDIALLAYSVAMIVRHEPDSYHNQQFRLFAGSLGQVFLVGGMLMVHRQHARREAGRSRRTIVPIGIAVCAIGVVATLVWSISLVR
jgi:peptidoglycan/LPS O-acetylase OafA/YrhL